MRGQTMLSDRTDKEFLKALSVGGVRKIHCVQIQLI
jgi:hypothetical protein